MIKRKTFNNLEVGDILFIYVPMAGKHPAHLCVFKIEGIQKDPCFISFICRTDSTDGRYTILVKMSSGDYFHTRVYGSYGLWIATDMLEILTVVTPLKQRPILFVGLKEITKIEINKFKLLCIKNPKLLVSMVLNT